MAGDPFKKVRPGERLKIPAAAYNGFVDAARMARGLHSAAGVPHWRHSGLVTVKNITEDDQPRFAALEINGPLFTPEENLHEFCDYVGFKAKTPTGLYLGHFVVLAEPIPAGGIGAATVSGPTQVKVEVVEEAQQYFRFADVWHDRSDVLEPMQFLGGAMILWMEFGLGTKWAIVRLSNMATTT